MTPITLQPTDLVIAALLLVVDGALSITLGLGVHRRLAVAGVRMVVQLLLVGVILRLVFSLASPALTLLLVVVMALIATREIAARPKAKLARWGNTAIAAIAVGVSTGLTAILALTTAILAARRLTDTRGRLRLDKLR